MMMTTRLHRTHPPLARPLRMGGCHRRRHRHRRCRSSSPKRGNYAIASKELTRQACPNAITFKEWFAQLRVSVTSICFKARRAMRWLCEVHGHAAPGAAGCAALANSGNFVRLDCNLSSCLLELLKPIEATEEIKRRTAHLHQRTDILTGRHILWLICKWLPRKRSAANCDQ